MHKEKLLELLHFIEVVAVIGTAIFALITLYDIKNLVLQSKNSTSGQLLVSLEGRFDDQIMTKIVENIDENKPIRRINGGQISDYQLDNYLGIYEVLDEVYQQHLINDNMFCDAFSYYLNKTIKNEEVQNYLIEIRKEDSTFFTGLNDLDQQLTQNGICK